MNQFLKNVSEITAWLDHHNICSYTLIPNQNYGYVVDVMGDVNLSNRSLSTIPVKFNKVDGFFWCNHNDLNSLDFAPVSVGGGFHCGKNRLTTLLGSPQSVGGDFLCWHNQLTTLLGGPNIIPTDFYCNDNLLTSLRHGPSEVAGDFDCADNHLKTLDFLPQSVGRKFVCENNSDLGAYQKTWIFTALKTIIDTKKEHAILSSSVSAGSLSSTKTHKI